MNITFMLIVHSCNTVLRGVHCVWREKNPKAVRSPLNPYLFLYTLYISQSVVEENTLSTKIPRSPNKRRLSSCKQMVANRQPNGPTSSYEWNGTLWIPIEYSHFSVECNYRFQGKWTEFHSWDVLSVFSCYLESLSWAPCLRKLLPQTIPSQQACKTDTRISLTLVSSEGLRPAHPEPEIITQPVCVCVSEGVCVLVCARWSRCPLRLL